MQLGILFIFIIVDIKIITSWASSIPCQSAVFTRNIYTTRVHMLSAVFSWCLILILLLSE